MQKANDANSIQTFINGICKAKRDKYGPGAAAMDADFLVCDVTSLGGIGKDLSTLLNRLHRDHSAYKIPSSARAVWLKTSSKTYWSQAISIAVAKANAEATIALGDKLLKNQLC